jgi:long-subunit fatty acid transport protein
MKKQQIMLAAMVLTLGVLSVNAFAAGVDLTGVGARATALGGNYRAISNDWSGMFWNPAGIVHTKGWHAGAGLEFIQPTVGYTPAAWNGQQYSATVAKEIENEPKTFLIPSAGVYYSTEKYAVGLGVWVPFGLGAKWDLLNTSTYNSAYPEFDFEDDLKVIDIHPTFSYKLTEKLSAGVGVSIITADIMIRKPNFTPNPYLDPKLALISANLPAAALASPYNHMLTETKLEGDGMGYGANIGLMYKPTETISIGVCAKYYADVPLEGTVDAKIYWANQAQANAVIQSPAISTALLNMYQGGLITQQQYLVLTSYYSGGTYDLAKEKKIKADLPLPMNVGAGIAYTGISNLLITADVALTQWSKWDVIKINDENGDEYSELVENWEDGIRAGIGLEYSLAFMKIRGSYYTEPQATVPETMTPTIPDPNRRHTVNLGVEVPFGPFRIHASYEKILVGDVDITTWQPTADLTGYENMAGKYSSNINNAMIGLDYQF